MNIKHALLTACIAAVLACSPVHSSDAAVTEKDVLVVGRLVNMLQDGPKGRVEVAVIRNGPASQEDANGLLAQIGAGKQVGDMTLVATAVRPEDVAQSKAQIILIPKGVDPAHFDEIFAAAKKMHRVTISNSDACLLAQRCALAIKTDPAVDIGMSQSAAAATGVSFGTSMRMIIKETP